MPITVITKSQSDKKYRILLSGDSQSGKTTSFRTFGIEGFVRCVNCPGEKGTRALPVGEGMESYVLEYAPLPEDAPIRETLALSNDLYQGFCNVVRSILRGEQGETHVLCLDGLLKFQEVCLDIASDGRFFK